MTWLRHSLRQGFNPFKEGFPKSTRQWALGNLPNQNTDWFQARSAMKARQACESRLGIFYINHPGGHYTRKGVASLPFFQGECK